MQGTADTVVAAASATGRFAKTKGEAIVDPKSFPVAFTTSREATWPGPVGREHFVFDEDSEVTLVILAKSKDAGFDDLETWLKEIIREAITRDGSIRPQEGEMYHANVGGHEVKAAVITFANDSTFDAS